MSMQHILKINTGDRFVKNHKLYEICYLDKEKLRYANFASGSMHIIDITDFEQSVMNGEIQHQAISITRPHHNLSLSTSEIKVYLDYLEVNNISNSNKKLQIAIDEVKKLNPSIKLISPATLHRYRKRFRDNFSLYSAFDINSQGNSSFRFSFETERIIHETVIEFATRKENFKPYDAWVVIRNKLLQIDPDAKIPCQRTIGRRFKKIDPFIILKSKKGSNSANKRFLAAGQSITSPILMGLVEMDTQLIDCILVNKNGDLIGRPYLTVIMDVFSRAIVGWNLSMFPACSTNTLLALKDMITRPNRGLMGGIPSIIVPDNGCEFNNDAVMNFCFSFGITKKESQPYKPNNKPHIERFFLTLNSQIIHYLPGTTFSSPSVRGDYDSMNYAKIVFPTLKSIIHDWIENQYHLQQHTSFDPPFNVWREVSKVTPPIFVSDLEAEIKCRTVYLRRINKGQVNICGLRYKSHTLATLETIFDKKIEVHVNTHDLSKVYIRDPRNNNNFIQADSNMPNVTKDLSLYEWEESKKILSEKYNLNPERIQQEEIVLLGRVNFLNLIQDLSNKSKKVRAVKNDLPKLIQKLEKQCQIVSEDNKSHSLNLNENQDINDHSNLIDAIDEYTYQEVNFDE